MAVWNHEPSCLTCCDQILSLTFSADAAFFLLCDAALTFGAVGAGPAGQTLTVTVPVAACGVVGTVNAHFRTPFAVVARRTNCNTQKVKQRKADVCDDPYV